MKAYQKVPDKGDPSDVLQFFPNFNLQLHCCRYWWLKHWEFKELSFPYWRVYHNSYQGAVILYNGKEYALRPDKILMIAPNTPYATRLYNHAIPETGYVIKGGQINSDFPESKAIKKEYILHLFIHFNLGMPYDNVSPGIFTYDLTDHLKEKLIRIKKHLNYEHARFSFFASLAIQSLICDLLVDLPKKNWDLIAKDYRIMDVLNYVENNVSDDLNNLVLSKISNLASNAFARLFTEEIGISPQKYVKKKKIDKACILLHHSNASIDEVAGQTGFADRYHFSRIFKQITSISPAMYKKGFGMKQ